MTAESPSTCPQCNQPIPTPRPPLCPRCHYPLLLIQQNTGLEREASDLQHPTPETPDDRTVVATPPVVLTGTVAPAGAAQGGPPPLACARCGFLNPPDRVWCEQCGNDLRRTVVPAAPVPAPAPPPAAPPPAQKSLWSWLWFPVALVVALALGVGTYLVLRDRGVVSSIGGPAESASAKPTPGATLSPQALGGITATASSTLPSESKKYAPSRTIDGEEKTAWNSNGKKIGARAEVTLRWDFDDPVQVGRIEIFNGYQLSQRRFTDNGRLRSVRIITESGERVVELKDVMGMQPVTMFAGPTSFVEFRVESVYRKGAKYPDLALSEVRFLGRPA